MVSPRPNLNRNHTANKSTSTLTSDDPKCACQPASKEPDNRSPPPIEATLKGSKKHHVRQLNQPGVDLDITFLPVERLVILREKMPGPYPRAMSCKTYVQLNRKNSTFINLEGLPDNSLLLTIQINNAGKYLKPQEKYMCHWPNAKEGRLYSELVMCKWRKMILQLRLPEPRVKDWKTVGLILRTFRKISIGTWNWMINLEGPPAVAGLNWEVIEKGGDDKNDNYTEGTGDASDKTSDRTSDKASDKSNSSGPGSFEIV